MNGAGTGLQVSMMKIQKVEATQPVLRLGLTASTAVVVGAAVLASVQFLTVAANALATASAFLLGSAWFVPVLIKI